MQSATKTVSDVQQFSKDRSEPQWLLDYRLKNERVFGQRPLKKSNYVSLSALEGILVRPQTEKNVLPDGFEKTGAKVFSWQDALMQIPQKVRGALEKEHAPKDQFEAFINAWFNCGFVVVLGKDTRVEKIVFESFFPSGSAGKILVIIENPEKEFVLLEKISGEKKLLLNETVWVLPNCRAAFLRRAKNQPDSIALLFQQAIVERDAVLSNSNAWLEGGLVRSNTFNILAGQGSEVSHLDFALLGQKQLFDINNTALHIATDTKSFTEIKSVLAGSAKNVFDGMIKILPSGQRTNALLEAHSVLLSANASSNNIPGLEIEADDVKATHSASVMQILDEQVFYLESRGIKKDTAKQLIVTGFLESIIFRLPKDFQEELFLAVEKKISGINGE